MMAHRFVGDQSVWGPRGIVERGETRGLSIELRDQIIEALDEAS
jgi:hypothetical protein